MSEMFYDASSFDQNLGPWFIVLEDTVVGHDKTQVTPISSQVTSLSSFVEFDANTDNYDITGADANYFTITDGHLVLNSPSDYNSKSQYDITITANNAGVDKLYLDVAPSISVTITVKQPSDTTVTSIARHNPLTQTTDSSTLQFKVLFSDDVTNVNSEDFELSSSSPTNTIPHTYTSTPSLFIPYDTVKTDTITVSDSDTVSVVSVAVDITHVWIGDLLVELISPDNQVVTLHNYAGDSADDIVKTYTLEYDDDVSINGDWQLRMYDNYSADSGTLNNWSIAFGDDSASNSITSVTGSGNLYYVTVVSPQAGTYNLDIAEDNDIVDASSNSLSSRIPTGGDQSYTVTATDVTATDVTTTTDTTPPRYYVS
jgi:subtilisin-like proprotein convertase family protein